jgi:hypothetical protein
MNFANLFKFPQWVSQSETILFRKNGGQIPFPIAKNPTLFGHKQLDLEGNIEQTA